MKAFNTFRPDSPSFPNTDKPIVEENSTLLKLGPSHLVILSKQPRDLSTNDDLVCKHCNY